jgi:hypothetical protein
MLVGVVSYSRGPTGESHDVISDKRIRLSATVPPKFSPYITFLGHIINIPPPIFSSPAAVPSKYSPYIPLHYKISFFIHTFHLL